MKDNRLLANRPSELHELERPAEQYSLSPEYVSYETAETSEINLKDYLQALRKYLWLILSIMLVSTILACIYVARLPDIYEAQARVQVDPESSSSVVNAAQIGGVVVSSSAANEAAYFETQLEILSSPGLLRKVIKNLDLEQDKIFLNPSAGQRRTTWENVLRIFGIKTVGEAKPMSAPPPPAEIPRVESMAIMGTPEDEAEIDRLTPLVMRIKGNLIVLQVGTTLLIDLSYQHPDPQTATRIVNGIAQTFVDTNMRGKTEANTVAAEFFNKRVAELQAEIRNGSQQLISYGNRAEITSLKPDENTVVDRLVKLNEQLLSAENARKFAEAEYRAALETGAFEAEGNKAKLAEDGEAQLAQLRQKLALLRVENTDEWQENKEVIQQISVLEKQIGDARKRATATAQITLLTKFKSTLDQEQALRSALNRQRGATQMQNAAAINYRLIEQEVESKKLLLTDLLQRAKENEIVLAGTRNNIRFRDRAPVPRVPIGPQRLRDVMLTSAFSMFFGVGLAFLLNYLDTTIRTTTDVEKMLHLPVLAVIPAIGGTGRRLLSTTALQRRDNNRGDELLINADTRSSLAEAFRQLRTSVLLSTAGHTPKTLLVTSGAPGEGKTTTAVNIATILAQTGASVLLIDGDLRRPRLHSIFDFPNERGLSTILSSDVSEADLLTFIEQHETSGLYVLTAGPEPPNPAELLGSEQMQQLLSIVESSFTHIVIDSPPVTTVTDGVILSTMVDGVLLVVHSGKGSRNVAQRARQVLHEVGAKLIGVVLNYVNQAEQRDGYYYGGYHR